MPFPPSSASLSSCVRNFLREGEHSQPRQRHQHGERLSQRQSKQLPLIPPSPEPPQPPRAELLPWPSPAQAVHLALWQGSSCCHGHTGPTNHSFTRQLRPPRGDRGTEAATATPAGTDSKPLHVLWGRKLLRILQAIQGSLLCLGSLRPVGIF